MGEPILVDHLEELDNVRYVSMASIAFYHPKYEALIRKIPNPPRQAKNIRAVQKCIKDAGVIYPIFETIWNGLERLDIRCPGRDLEQVLPQLVEAYRNVQETPEAIREQAKAIIDLNPDGIPKRGKHSSSERYTKLEEYVGRLQEWNQQRQNGQEE